MNENSEDTCAWEVSKGVPCGEPSQGTVLLRDRIGSARIKVCKNHRAEYNRKAAQLRGAHK